MSETETGHWVTDAIREYGGCGLVNPDGTKVCPLNYGHEQPHEWTFNPELIDEGGGPRCGLN